MNTPEIPDWECLACAREVSLAADDYCPHCGAELPQPRGDITPGVEELADAAQEDAD